MNLYVYALSEAAGAQALAEGAGVGGARTFVLECVGGMGAVVSEFAGERVEVTRENLRAHNCVNGRLLAETTPLPFRFGTLTSAARLEQYTEANRAALLAAFARVRGCVEMSVKIMWDVAALRRAAETAVETRASTEGPGAAYLAAKRRALAGDEALKAKADEIVAWLGRIVAEAARESRVVVVPERELVLRAAHLVERERVSEYRERVQTARAERGRELRFLTSGAWPPYSFSEVSSPKQPARVPPAINSVDTTTG